MKEITLTYLNVRQSIAILLTKLILIDFILAGIIIGEYFILVQGELFAITASSNTAVFLSFFAIGGFVKIALSIYIVLQWLFEYYEITPEAIIHKKGIINRTTECYSLDKIRRISVLDTFIGEICNFATISLYDIRLNKTLDLYLIHNPDRYATILKTLKPELEMKSNRKVLPFMPKREDLAESREL